MPFRSVQNVTIDSSETYSDAKPLGEAFFLPAAERGVRHIKHYDDITANTAAALTFGFAEPASGGDRSLIGIDCGIGTDFLSQVQQVRLLYFHLVLLKQPFDDGV